MRKRKTSVVLRFDLSFFARLCEVAHDHDMTTREYCEETIHHIVNDAYSDAGGGKGDGKEASHD